MVVTSTSSYSPLPLGEGQGEGSSFALAGISHVDAYGNVLASHGYTYNDQGLIETYTHDTDSVDYSYDPTGQLIDADYDVQDDETFSYDANGNQLQFTIGANNQILCDGLYWYSYDAEGSRTEKYQWTDANADGLVDDSEKFDLTTYSWDARGRLIKITTLPDGSEATKTVKYSYDYLNRRTEKQIKETSSEGKKVKSRESYTYLGHDIVLQSNDGEHSHRYLHNPNAVDQCLADEDVLEDNTLYPLFDNLNSVRDIVDYDEVLDETLGVNHIDYSASGKVVAETDPTIKHIYGHAGRERDDESDLLGNGERYFDPDLLCFISQDRLGYFAHDTNLYRYVHNDPVNFVDSTGLEEETPTEEEFWNDVSRYLDQLGDAHWDLVSAGENLDEQIRNHMHNPWTIANFKSLFTGKEPYLELVKRRAPLNERMEEIDAAIDKLYPLFVSNMVSESEDGESVLVVPAGFHNEWGMASDWTRLQDALSSSEEFRKWAYNYGYINPVCKTGHALTRPGDDLLVFGLAARGILVAERLGGIAATKAVLAEGAEEGVCMVTGSPVVVTPGMVDNIFRAKIADSELKRIADIRASLAAGAGKDRNIAYAEGHVNGIDIGEVLGVSGENTAGVKMVENRLFETFMVSGRDRDFDSEVFVLENLASRLEPDAAGTIRLVSERKFCNSCSDVIEQFHEKFPNIRLILVDGAK